MEGIAVWPLVAARITPPMVRAYLERHGFMMVKQLAGWRRAGKYITEAGRDPRSDHAIETWVLDGTLCDIDVCVVRTPRLPDAWLYVRDPAHVLQQIAYSQRRFQLAIAAELLGPDDRLVCDCASELQSILRFIDHTGAEARCMKEVR